MGHRHRMAHEQGPFCCSDGVRYVETCGCGAKRHVCDCRQCHAQNQSTSPWVMPVCDCCKLRHPADVACNNAAIGGMED